MTITIEQFAARCHDILKAENNAAGREKVLDVVREALTSPEFVAKNIPDDCPERKIIYQDAELGFCILAHNYIGAKESAPHDHGPTWAIYGQATGETIMTDWEKLSDAAPGKPGTCRRVRDYVLTPGMAYAYDPGALHSPKRHDSTKLIRMEGVDVSKIGRHAYRAVD